MGSARRYSQRLRKRCLFVMRGTMKPCATKSIQVLHQVEGCANGLGRQAPISMRASAIIVKRRCLPRSDSNTTKRTQMVVEFSIDRVIERALHQSQLRSDVLMSLALQS